MLTSKNSLFFTLSFVLLHLGQCWKYCDQWDGDRDKFGVSNCEVKPRSLDSVLFKLKGTPEVNIGRGGGDLVPKIELKLYDVDSNKKIYSATKDLCDFTDCSLKKDKKATINVHVSDLDTKLKRDVFYRGEMTVIEKCGTKITCVQDKFCIAKNDDGSEDDNDNDNKDRKNNKDKGKNKNVGKVKKKKSDVVVVVDDPSSGGDPDAIVVDVDTSDGPIVFGEGDKKNEIVIKKKKNKNLK